MEILLIGKFLHQLVFAKNCYKIFSYFYVCIVRLTSVQGQLICIKRKTSRKCYFCMLLLPGVIPKIKGMLFTLGHSCYIICVFFFVADRKSPAARDVTKSYVSGIYNGKTIYITQSKDRE